MQQLLAEIYDAIVGGDVTMLARSTHRLKGLVSNFGARTVSEMALNLGAIRGNDDLAGASGTFAV
jgi:HPt (histidine-containing phosphotransfer) domain-containing protein